MADAINTDVRNRMTDGDWRFIMTVNIDIHLLLTFQLLQRSYSRLASIVQARRLLSADADESKKDKKKEKSWRPAERSSSFDPVCQTSNE